MDERRLVVALACALLAVSAGCAGLTGSDGGLATDATATATETTTGPEQLAPGVTTEGVQNAQLLADAHLANVENQTFVTHDRVRRTNASGTAFRNATLAMTNESHWTYSVSTDGMSVGSVFAADVFETYADGERMLWRTDNGSAVQYGVYSFQGETETVVVPPDQAFERSYHGLYQRDLVYTLAASADDVHVLDDSEAVELAGSVDELAIDRRQVTDAEFTLTVAADGLAQSVDLTYESGNATVNRSLSFTAAVADPVAQPDWYETALNRTVTNATA